LAIGHAALDRDVLEGPVVVVAVEDGGRGIAGHVDVEPAVAVEIGGGGRHRVSARDPGRAGGFRDVAEASVPFVVEEEVRVRGQALGPTVDGDSLPQAVGSGAGPGRVGEIELQVVRDEEVHLPIAVVVDERAAGAPARPRGGQPGGGGDVFEPALAVVVQDVRPVGGYEQVEPTVVVVVTSSGTGRPVGAAESR